MPRDKPVAFIHSSKSAFAKSLLHGVGICWGPEDLVRTDAHVSIVLWSSLQWRRRKAYERVRVACACGVCVWRVACGVCV